jgi:hypothetical protein
MTAKAKRRNARGARGDAKAAATLVEAVLKARGVSGAVREHRLVTSWHEVVGERIAARTWPTGLQRGVLWVQVANSAWMQELSFLKEAIARSANELVGPPTLVKEVRLHLPGKAEQKADPDDVVAALARRVRRKKVPPPPRVVTAADVTRIDGETAKIADPELRGAIRGLRRKLGL